MTVARQIVAARAGVALAELTDEDRAVLDEQGDGAWDVDPDDRPALHVTFEVHRLAIVDADTHAVIGSVNWHAVGYGRTAACTAWNVGIGLLPAARGRGAGPTALRLLIEHLFATTEVDRVEASADVQNVASQKALRKAGMRREGVLRGAQFRGGKRHDMVGFGILRSDLPDPDAVREIVATGEGIALGTPLPSDDDALSSRYSSDFDIDPDDRPLRHHPTPERLVVLDRVTEEPIGTVSWHAVGYGPTAACEAWNIGLALVPDVRGRGIGATVTRLVAEYLFASTDIDRIEASTDRENVPAQRVLAKAGFRPEGLVRGGQLRGGRRRDLVSYSLLRTDVVEDATAIERHVVIERDGVVLAEPGPGDREAFYVAAAGDFQVDQDDRPRVAGPARTSLFSVLDAETGDLLGGVSWHAVDYGGTVACSAWNIGIGLLPSARGRGIGTIAQRLLVEHLLATTELDRIEASTDIENVAEQRALEKAGFRREGVLRGAQLRGGVRRDLVHYGLVRSDVEA